MPDPIPTKIGRFHIERELGRGSQGVVYLANDSHLGRQVAIKTLHRHKSINGKSHERLMQEARNVSKLKHPNIVPIFDVGEYQEKPYLVFEYVEGICLKDLIKEDGTIVVYRAVKMMQQVLNGIACAHEQGIVHRDMSPANIMLSMNDIPRIMDFGISIMTGVKQEMEGDLSGTPCYMSPEHFSKEPLGPQSDIFALGLIFWEMLAGYPAVEADHHFAVMYKIANEPIEPPSLKNNTVDKRLDRIIMKALERDPGERYSNAQEMEAELGAYLEYKWGDDAARKDDKGANVTLEFLLQRMRHKSDFPAFSEHIMEINKKASASGANYTSASELANAVLKDYALTNKLLKMVNSSFYGRFSAKITTVSRAVVALGFEQVKLAASGLMLFEHMKNNSQTKELRDTAVSSFMSGLIAKDLAKRVGFEETEEAFICSMLNNLGKYLVLFYFQEEYAQIKNLMAQKGMEENNAVRSVLGISYEELGIGVARKWEYPNRIVNSMESLPQGKLEEPGSDEDMLRNLSSFSNDLCSIFSNPEDDYEGMEKSLNGLVERFQEGLPLPKKQISKLLENAGQEMETYADILKVDLKWSRLVNQLTDYQKAREREAPKEKEKIETESRRHEKAQEDYQALEIPESPAELEETVGPSGILINGIQEITNALSEDYELNEILTMILETMYRGFNFTRVLFCITDVSRTKMTARFGFGKEIERVIEGFSFDIGPSSDLFNISITQAKDLGIEDIDDPRLKKGIPQWYDRAISAPAFVLYPIILNKIAFGLIYGDKERKGRVFSRQELSYMNTLRNQAVLALKQSRR
ncbi:HDOD domain-containing protein [Thermodesulfobacteriota bacterium]